jgi:hypothetical protein
MHKAVNAAEEGAARREQNGTLGVLPNAGRTLDAPKETP